MDVIESIRKLMKENPKALGFIPITGIKIAYAKNRIITYIDDNELKGYLYFGPLNKDNHIKIYQLCIKEDSKRKGIGKKLFNGLLEKFSQYRVTGIRVRCADDLKANYFWRSHGFELIDTVLSKNKERYINIYFYKIKK